MVWSEGLNRPVSGGEKNRRKRESGWDVERIHQRSGSLRGWGKRYDGERRTLRGRRDGTWKKERNRNGQRASQFHFTVK